MQQFFFGTVWVQIRQYDNKSSCAFPCSLTYVLSIHHPSVCIQIAIRKEKGVEVDDDFVRSIFAFLQEMDYDNFDFLKDLSARETTTEVWKKWISKFVSKESITPAQGTPEITIPGKILRKENILKAQEALVA